MLLSWPFKKCKISLPHFFTRFTEPRKKKKLKNKNVNIPNNIKNPNSIRTHGNIIWDIIMVLLATLKK